MWLWKDNKTQLGLMRVTGKKKSMFSAIDKMTPGDMQNFEPAMKMALKDLQRVKASVKHMIVISDGDPSAPTNQTLAAYKKANIQVTTVLCWQSWSTGIRYHEKDCQFHEWQILCRQKPQGFTANLPAGG